MLLLIQKKQVIVSLELLYICYGIVSSWVFRHGTLEQEFRICHWPHSGGYIMGFTGKCLLCDTVPAKLMASSQMCAMWVAATGTRRAGGCPSTRSCSCSEDSLEGHGRFTHHACLPSLIFVSPNAFLFYLCFSVPDVWYDREQVHEGMPPW